jgi:hypothetical protein
VLWNQEVQTDTEVLAYRHDIIVTNKKVRTCLLIDIAKSSDRYVIQKEAEKKLKYKNIIIRILRMWKMKCVVTQVITGTTGIVSKSLKNIWKQNQESIQ